MKSKIPIMILLAFLLAACSNEKNTDSPATAPSPENATTQTLEQFQGHIAEKETEADGREKVLVVKGITQRDALEAAYEDVDTENMIWFVSEENLFHKMKKGTEVKIWWDNSTPHPEPAILTLEAKKAEVINE